MAAVETKARTHNAAEAAGGRVGISERPFVRLYHTWGGPPMDNAGLFINAFHELNAMNGADPRHRHVLRSLMTSRGMHDLVAQRRELPATVEFALPVQVGGEQMFFVGAGKNGPERQTKHPSKIRDDILVYQKPPMTLAEHIQHVKDSGFHATTVPVTPTQIGSVASIWEHAFGGWDGRSVSEFAGRLLEQSDPRFPADQRTDVFTGIVNKKGEIVAATMAQAMVLQPNFTLWESTEWTANTNVRGLVAASAALTKAQIIQGYEGRRDYTLIAETNSEVPASGVANKVGMVMPRVISGDFEHHQTLSLNVGVNDGKPGSHYMEEGGRIFPMRNFGVHQLPQEAIDRLYKPFLPGFN